MNIEPHYLSLLAASSYLNGHNLVVDGGRQSGNFMPKTISINSIHLNFDNCCFLQAGPHVFHEASHYKIYTLSSLFATVIVLGDNSFTGSDIVDTNHTLYG